MRTISTLVVAAMLVAACGGSGDDSDAGAADADDPTTATTTETSSDEPADEESGDDAGVDSADTSTTAAPATTTTVPAAVADAILIEPNLDLRTLAATAFAPVVEPEPVAVGDVLRTDTTGYAEIAYFDGSRTRLDIDTEFEVLELVDTIDTATIRTRMGLGRTWHRVQQLGEADTYEVETSVATAVVQGTAFTIACPTDTSCTFMVVEGALLLTLTDGTEIELVAPAALTIDSTGAGDPTPVPFDGAFADPWLFDNAARDAQAGDASAAEIYQAHGPIHGSITGTFTGTRTVRELECFGACLPDEPPVGDVADRSYAFEIDCSAGIPCAGVIDTEYRKDAVVQSQVVPLEFDGTSYHWGLEWSDSSCFSDDDGDGTPDRFNGNLDTRIEWTMTPTAGEIVDDRWVVTAMSGDATAVNTVTDPGDCTDGWLGGTQVSAIEVTRAP